MIFSPSLSRALDILHDYHRPRFGVGLAPLLAPRLILSTAEILIMPLLFMACRMPSFRVLLSARCATFYITPYRAYARAIHCILPPFHGNGQPADVRIPQAPFRGRSAITSRRKRAAIATPRYFRRSRMPTPDTLGHGPELMRAARRVDISRDSTPRLPTRDELLTRDERSHARCLARHITKFLR